ncbi:MAG: hypothetical protein EPN41_00690 [Candidimonas sp.]|nr:MAG: hypothetical protein EPN41_00690 [Candidimonas sp.]
MKEIVARSVLTCPNCGYSETRLMPVDSCQFYYECPKCGRTFRPKPGDCCVFCSYGSVPCPSVQARRARSATDPS